MKTKKTAVYGVLTIALMCMLCAAPQDPWKDADNAKVNETRTRNTLPATITAYHDYPCTLFVTIPELIDSIQVVRRQGAADSVFTAFTNLEAGDSVLVFYFVIDNQEQASLQVLSYRKNGTVDTAVISLSMRYPPSVVPDSLYYLTYVKQAVDVKFNVTDPDGDIRSCEVYVDSTTGQAVTTNLSGSSASVTRNVSGPSFDTMVVFARAFDSAWNASVMAACTVFVMDTSRPALMPIGITPSIGDTLVKTLPCTLFVRVLDDSPIDSVKFEGQHVPIRNDTAIAVAASLDSGKSTYSVTAWDKAGNMGTRDIPITYTGTIKYKLTLKSGLGRTVAENQPIPGLWLDTCISSIVPDPSTLGIPNWKDSIQWSVTAIDTMPGSLKANLAANARLVTFAVPDSEWNGTQVFTLLANWPNTAVATASESYTITDIPDPPRITLKAVNKKARIVFDTVWADTCAIDPDNKSNTLTWMQDTSIGKVYTLQWISGMIIIIPPIGKQQAVAAGNWVGAPVFWSRKWVVVPKNPKSMFIIGSTYHDTLRLMATDPGGLSSTKDIPITATY